MKDSDLWEMENKWDKRYSYSRILPWESFQDVAQRETLAEFRWFRDLWRWSCESSETEAARVSRMVYWK